MMSRNFQCFQKSVSGYSLIEAVIAGFLLVLAIAGAALLAQTITLTEDANTAVSRALNTQEQAAKLWALGLNSTQITNILPETFTSSSTPAYRTLKLSFTETTTNITGVGDLELAVSVLTFPVGSDRDGNALYRTNTNNLARPSIR